MTPTRPLLFASAIALTGCFSPTPFESDDDEPSDGSTTADDGDGTDEPDEPVATGSSSDPSADEGATTGDPPEPETDTEADPASVCGDGIVDDDEQCDLGEGNGPESTCLSDCILNVCGDGALSPDEACDDGEANELAVGACAPDCSTVIETRRIALGGAILAGDFGANPVATADSQCEPGWRAMFTVAGVRQATTVPYQSVDALDWVLAPYTAYVREDETLLWITDDVPLLGVRDGAPVPLVDSIVPECPALCADNTTVTGMNADWTTPPPFDCDGWSSGSSGIRASFGDHRSTTDFLMAGEVDCEFQPPPLLNGAAQFYCVEE